MQYLPEIFTAVSEKMSWTFFSLLSNIRPSELVFYTKYNLLETAVLQVKLNSEIYQMRRTSSDKLSFECRSLSVAIHDWFNRAPIILSLRVG